MFSWAKKYFPLMTKPKVARNFNGPKINVEDLKYVCLPRLTGFESYVFELLQATETNNNALEEWVYSNEELEPLLSEDDYLALIYIDYKQRSAPYEAIKVLEKYINQSRYHEYQLREVLGVIANRRSGVGLALEQCYDMYSDGYDFLDDLGLGYGLNFYCDNHGTSPKDISMLYPEVGFEATKVLRWLNTEKIIISGHNGNYRGLEYQDNRAI